MNIFTKFEIVSEHAFWDKKLMMKKPGDKKSCDTVPLEHSKLKMNA
jgi:hypothetical protein